MILIYIVVRVGELKFFKYNSFSLYEKTLTLSPVVLLNVAVLVLLSSIIRVRKELNTLTVICLDFRWYSSSIIHSHLSKDRNTQSRDSVILICITREDSILTISFILLVRKDLNTQSHDSERVLFSSWEISTRKQKKVDFDRSSTFFVCLF